MPANSVTEIRHRLNLRCALLDVVGAQQLPPQAPAEPPAVAEPAPVAPVTPVPDQPRQIDEVVLTPPVTDSTSTTGIVSEQSSAPQAGVPQAAQVATQQVSAQKPKVLRLRVGSFLDWPRHCASCGFHLQGATYRISHHVGSERSAGLHHGVVCHSKVYVEAPAS